MSDPAVEAAKRAVMPDHHWWLTQIEDDLLEKVCEYAESAAREALAPLRAKHQRVQRPDGSWRCTSCRNAYGGHADFPTGTDRRIYSDAELVEGGAR